MSLYIYRVKQCTAHAIYYFQNSLNPLLQLAQVNVRCVMYDHLRKVYDYTLFYENLCVFPVWFPGFHSWSFLRNLENHTDHMDLYEYQNHIQVHIKPSQFFRWVSCCFLLLLVAGVILYCDFGDLNHIWSIFFLSNRLVSKEFFLL